MHRVAVRDAAHLNGENEMSFTGFWDIWQLANIYAESPMRTTDFWNARIDEHREKSLLNSISDAERDLHQEAIKFIGLIVDDILNDRGLFRIRNYHIWLSKATEALPLAEDEDKDDEEDDEAIRQDF